MNQYPTEAKSSKGTTEKTTATYHPTDQPEIRPQNTVNSTEYQSTGNQKDEISGGSQQRSYNNDNRQRRQRRNPCKRIKNNALNKMYNPRNFACSPGSSNNNHAKYQPSQLGRNKAIHIFLLLFKREIIIEMVSRHPQKESLRHKMLTVQETGTHPMLTHLSFTPQFVVCAFP